jgi:hypothetical protein
MTTRKETRSIGDLIADTAYRKQRAAQARFAGTPPGQEKPRDVYLAGCASISGHLEECFGFSYSKSGPHARKRSGEFVFQVGFQSSNLNVAGEHVAMWIHANVLSPKMKKWRQGHPHLHPSEYVAGGQLGNLRVNHAWLEWDLANARQRDEKIRDAINAIEDIAFPYFARFEDLAALFQTLVAEGLPSMMIDHVIEFLMCFADQGTAKQAGLNFLKKRSDLVQDYRDSFQKYSRTALETGGPRPSGFANQLAFASHEFQFGDLSSQL